MTKEIGAQKQICECLEKGRTPDSYVVTQLRIPRNHVLSEYMMCKDRGPQPYKMPDKFEDWVMHDFSKDLPPKVHFDKLFHCYTPLNSQTNFYTGGKYLDTDERLYKAQNFIDHTVNFVSVLEIFPVLVCVLRFIVTNVLPEWCPCNDEEIFAETNDVIENAGEVILKDHGVGHLKFEDMSLEVQHRIDNITTRDVLLYLRALPRALREIHYAETLTNTTLFCKRDRSAFREQLESGIPDFYAQLDRTPGGSKVRADLLR